MDEKLRACDCGAEDSIHMNVTYVPSREDSFFLEYRVQCGCLNCGRHGPIATCDTEREARATAVAGWNARPEEDALRTLLDRARDMLTDYPPHYEDYGGDCYCGPCDAKLEGRHADDCEYEQLLADINAALGVKA